MKNLHLLAISVGMAIGSAAMAEPSVTLYGIFDGGVSVSKLQHQSAKVQMTNGNWLSNRWGLMGQEDLGGGNSMYFKLEQGFNLSNGSEAVAGKAFNRETALGLSGDWGSFCAAWTSDGRRVMCDRAGSNHFVHLYEVPALRRRTDHHQHCDGACSFAIHRRNSSIGSERSIDAVFVSI